MINQYRKKPVIVDAIHLDSPEMFQVAHAWIKKSGGSASFFTLDGDDWTKSSTLAIHTLEGTMVASPYDWIIRGVQGEFYPCKPDIFEVTYEKQPDLWDEMTLGERRIKES